MNNDDPLIETGQGRTDADMESAMYGGSVAFTGLVLTIIAAIVWLLLLSGCGVPRRAMPEDALRAILQGDAK